MSKAEILSKVEKTVVIAAAFAAAFASPFVTVVIMRNALIENNFLESLGYYGPRWAVLTAGILLAVKGNERRLWIAGASAPAAGVTYLWWKTDSLITSASADAVDLLLMSMLMAVGGAIWAICLIPPATDARKVADEGVMIAGGSVLIGILALLPPYWLTL